MGESNELDILDCPQHPYSDMTLYFYSSSHNEKLQGLIMVMYLG